MRERRFWRGVAVALPVAAVACGSSDKKENGGEDLPNVIFIMADDMGWGDLSPYGTSAVRTPAVEELARSGTLFRDAHSVAATSTPSRYSLLTGHYAWKREDTGVANGDAPMVIRPEQYTVADLFREAGYRTAAVGKWHLGLGDKTGEQDWNGLVTPNASDIGFDYSYIMAATGDRVPCVWIEQGRVVNHDPTAPIEVRYGKNFEGAPTGRENPELLYKLHPSHGHDHSIVHGISRIGYMRGGGKALWQDEHIADSLTVNAVRFIRENAERRFFLYLCTNDIHVPRYPHERFRGKSGLGLRGDAILSFDDTVRAVLEELERLGLRENTLIILSSDNGPVLDDGYEDQAEELLGDHRQAGDFRGGKYSLYEAGTRVPFIVSWPGKVPAGESVDFLVSQVDFLRSMAALLGHDLPEGAGVDSQDELATWLNQGGDGRDWAIVQGLGNTTALRVGNMKYIPAVPNPRRRAWQTGIETGQDTIPQLYNLRDDTSEHHNLLNK